MFAWHHLCLLNLIKNKNGSFFTDTQNWLISSPKSFPVYLEILQAILSLGPGDIWLTPSICQQSPALEMSCKMYVTTLPRCLRPDFCGDFQSPYAELWLRCEAWLWVHSRGSFKMGSKCAHWQHKEGVCGKPGNKTPIWERNSGLGIQFSAQHMRVSGFGPQSPQGRAWERNQGSAGRSDVLGEWCWI